MLLVSRCCTVSSTVAKRSLHQRHHAAYIFKRHFHISPHQRSLERPISSLYVDTTPPTSTDLAAASLFFRTHTPLKTWTAAEWRKNQPHNAAASPSFSATSNANHLTPEVAFLGRSNSGKSSLMNALLMSPGLCRVGPKPGKTSTMHAWSLSPLAPPSPKDRNKAPTLRRGWHGDTSPKLNVLDMPGYGHGSHAEWGKDIMKYLVSRRQLRRAFVLVNPTHGLKKGDLQILELLKSQGVSWQVVACKCDDRNVGDLENALQGLKAELESALGSNGVRAKGQSPSLLTISDILAVGGLGDGKANRAVKAVQMKGVEDVRWAVLRAAGLEDYALAIMSNGGLPPKPTTPTRQDTVSPSNERERLVSTSPIHHFSAVDDNIREPLRQTQPSPRDSEEKVGFGIEQFMAMAFDPPQRPEDKSLSSYPSASSSSSSSSLKQSMRSVSRKPISKRPLKTQYGRMRKSSPRAAGSS